MHGDAEMLLASCSLVVQVRLACTAEVSPEDLFQGIQLSEGEEEGSRLLMDDLGIAAVRQTDRQTDRPVGRVCLCGADN